MSKLSTLLLMGASAAVGSFVTYKIVTKKAEQKANEEIAEMRKHYLDKEKELGLVKKEETEETEGKPEPEAVTEYNNIIDNLGYHDIEAEKKDDVTNNNVVSSPAPAPVKTKSKHHPFVIDGDELGHDNEWDVLWFSAYTDGVVVDEDMNIVDIEDTITQEMFDLFNTKYADEDEIYIRREDLQTDYVIERYCCDYRDDTRYIGD